MEKYWDSERTKKTQRQHTGEVTANNVITIIAAQERTLLKLGTSILAVAVQENNDF